MFWRKLRGTWKRVKDRLLRFRWMQVRGAVVRFGGQRYSQTSAEEAVKHSSTGNLYYILLTAEQLFEQVAACKAVKI